MIKNEDIYKVDDEFVEMLEEAQKNNTLPCAEDTENCTKDEMLEKAKKISYVIANKKIKLESLKTLKKEIQQQIDSVTNAIDFLTDLQKRNILAVYGDDIQTAKKETKGFLNFRKSASVNIPDEVEIALANGELKLEKIDAETGEIIDVTNDYVTEKIERKIKKSELSKELKNGTSISAITKDGETKIDMEEKQSISIPKLII